MANGFQGPPAVDFYSQLSGMGDDIRKNQVLAQARDVAAMRQGAIAKYSQLDPNSADFGRQVQMLSSEMHPSDAEGAFKFIGLGHQAQQEARQAARQAAQDKLQRERYGVQDRNTAIEHGFRREAIDNAQEFTPEELADRAVRSGLKPGTPEYQQYTTGLKPDAPKEPPAYRWKADGSGAEFTPGGSADPVERRKLDKPAHISVTDVKKLEEEGGKFSNIAGFVEDFKDEYAGYGNAIAGGLAQSYGRYAPDKISSPELQASSAFWQGYDRFKNVVRNDLYGSALTASEIKAFAAADIDPGMNPALIKKNLAIQKKIAEKGVRSKADTLVEAGYDRMVIAKAYGIHPDTITPKGQMAPATKRILDFTEYFSGG